MSRIFDTVDSPNSFVVQIFSTPLRFTHPLITSSSTVTIRGKRTGIQCAGTLHHAPVNWDLFSGLYNNDGADPHFVRIYALQSSITLHIGIIRPDVHQRADVPPALANGIALKQLANLIKQHHGDGFCIIPAVFDQCNGDRADGCDSHQKVFIKHPPVEDALSGLLQNIIADDQIGKKIEEKPGGFPHLISESAGCQAQRNQQNCRDKDAREHFFLLFVHSRVDLL